ncbi:MAG: hypothetical protein APF81_12745 [Desulfosporosinus sp. BRH_c37]|nr:MAG: hypothetical protein APF81_12745 [Desulfosporosinus sp. BRH_c37]
MKGDEVMPFHPADTTNLYEGLNKELLVDQLWYRVHYFQQKSLERDSNRRLESLSPEVKLNAMSRTFIDNRLKQRQVALLLGLQHTHTLAVVNGKLNGKLLHGLGGAHVRETSLTLHPLYGIPYLPAASIKGVVRNWAIQAIFNGQEKELKNGNDSTQEKKDRRAISADLFGNEEQAGEVEFFDAFVDCGFALKPDVLTVHFPNYYRGSSLPGDNQDPNPINFYAINCQSVQFTVGIRQNARLKSGYTANELLELAVAWLEKALTELGIGSKSSSGYGYFTDFEDVTAQTRHEANMDLPAKPSGIGKVNRVESKVPVKAEPPANFTPAQKLVFEIQHFTEADLLRSKDKSFFDKVVEVGEQGNKEPVLALKIFWEKNGAWKADNKKQKLKIERIKEVLGGQ